MMVYLAYILLILLLAIVFNKNLRVKIRKFLIGKGFREYLIFLCSLMIGASAGVVTIFLVALSVIFAMELGINPKLSETDILMSNSKTIWFIGIYGIISGSMFWYIKKILKKEN